MRGIAKIMQENGHSVYGFDNSPEKIKGINYSCNLPNDTDLIVYSSAIKENHPLRKEASLRDIPTMQRTDFFIQHMPLNEIKILIAGAHGKTTTSAMIAYMLGSKSYYIGGIIINENTSSKFVKNSLYTVIETDESDGSFTKWNYKNSYKILLNFDYEHMLFYKTNENIKKHYYEFVMNQINSSKVIILKEAKNELSIPDHPNIITYGEKNSDFVCTNIKPTNSEMSCEINGKKIIIPLIGNHNAYNFTAAYALFTILGEPTCKINTFPGVKKRMQKIKYKNHSLDFYLDYGHHPTEIKSVLKSLNEHYPTKKFDIVFEPHKPSRILDTLHLWPETFKNYKVFLYRLYIADEYELNQEKLKFSTEKLLDFFLSHNIDTVLLKNDLSNLILNQNNLICFSAGKLSEILSKY